LLSLLVSLCGPDLLLTVVYLWSFFEMRIFICNYLGIQFLACSRCSMRKLFYNWNQAIKPFYVCNVEWWKTVVASLWFDNKIKVCRIIPLVAKFPFIVDRRKPFGCFLFLSEFLSATGMGGELLWILCNSFSYILIFKQFHGRPLDFCSEMQVETL